jgi:hypothetical protein
MTNIGQARIIVRGKEGFVGHRFTCNHIIAQPVRQCRA